MNATPSTLTAKVRAFRQNQLSWNRLVAACVPEMHAALDRAFRSPREERCEVISEFYPRMHRVVGEFRDTGTPFEAYLSRCVTNCFRTWYRRDRRRADSEVLFCDETDYSESIVDDREPEATESGAPRHGVSALRVDSRGRDAIRRQTLFVLCQNVPLLNDAECNRFAELYDLPEAYLGSIREYVQQVSVARTARRTRYRERRDRHYASMIRAERALAECDDPNAREILDGRSRRHREQWEYYRHRLSRQTMALTHRDVARLFGVSKGSVDSSMAYLQARLERMTANG